MKKIPILIGLVLLAGIGAGVYLLVAKSPASHVDADDAPAPDVAPIVTVQTGTPKRMTMHVYLDAFGTVDAAPSTVDTPASEAQLAAPVAGVIADVRISEGVAVRKGDVLIRLNSALATFAGAEAELERRKTLYAQQNGSLKSLQEAEAQLASLQIVAPISGVVIKLDAHPGQAVDGSRVLVGIMDLAHLVLNVSVPISRAGDVKNGQIVEVESTPPIQTKISRVNPMISADGVVTARAVLPENCGLRPGQFLAVKILTDKREEVLVVPIASVVTDDAGESVISVVHGTDSAQVPVTTGVREDGWVEITSMNVTEHDVIVTVGAYGLPEKAKIKLGETNSSVAP